LKNLTKYFLNKDILFKEIKEIFPKEIGSRKKIGIYLATSVTKEYYSIFLIDAKSRFIRKNAIELIALNDKLETFVDHNFKRKELLILSPLCSKTKKFLQDNKWKVRIDFM
jgi:hypothetical protein